MPDFVEGPVKEVPVAFHSPRPIRKFEEFKGEFVTNTETGKFKQGWVTKEKCGVDTGRGKCEYPLNVKIYKTTTFERDESGFGGQLMYDDKEMRAFKWCPLHGPWDVPEEWKAVKSK